MTNENNNAKHALIRLLKDAGYSLIASEANYGFYDTLKEALNKDGKQSYVDSDNSRASMLYKPINDTDDLFEGEHYFAHSLVETWGLSVISPLVDNINNLLGSNILQVCLEGGVATCILYADIYQEESSKALQELDVESLKQIEGILSEWSNTCNYIVGIEVLQEAIAQAVKTKNH